MKKFVIASLLSVSMVSLAVAADLPVVKSDETIVPVTFSGFYAGIGSGLNWTNHNSASASGSIFTGYSFRTGDVYFGPEISFDYLNRNGLNYKGNINGKLGYALTDDLAVYGLAGYSIGRFNIDGNHFKSGYNVGAGVEKYLTENISAKVEYNFARFPSFDSDNHAVNFGLSYHFDSV